MGRGSFESIFRFISGNPLVLCGAFLHGRYISAFIYVAEVLQLMLMLTGEFKVVARAIPLKDFAGLKGKVPPALFIMLWRFLGIFHGLLSRKPEIIFCYFRTTAT